MPSLIVAGTRRVPSLIVAGTRRVPSLYQKAKGPQYYCRMLLDPCYDDLPGIPHKAGIVQGAH